MDKANAWGEKRSKAIALVAADFLSLDKIATECGITISTLTKWLEKPEVKRKVEILRDQSRERIMQRGIAEKTERIQKADERWRKMHQVIDERAADPTMQAVPGGSTGLLTRTEKSIGPKGDNKFVEEYEVDTGLLSEIRAHEEMVSIELGQRPKEGGEGTLKVRAVVMMPGPSQQPTAALELELKR